MGSYRDSYFQYHHLVDSHQILYNEWNQDELPPPDEQEIGNNNLKMKQGGSNSNNGSNGNVEASEGASKRYSGPRSNTNAYWDYFHDEEDWNLFKNVQLESNGVATFNQPPDTNAQDESKGAQVRTNPDYEASNAITGSIFNNKVVRMAMVQNSNWNDLSMPHPE